MPNATAQAAQLRGMDLEELAALYRGSDETTARRVLAECARLDRLDAWQAQRDQVRAEWHELAYSDYLAAEAECRGELVNPEGCKAGVRDGFALWSGPRERAERYATEELREFWLTHPRITVTEYAAMRAAEQRTARLEATEVTSDGRDTDRAEVDGPAPAGHGRGSGTDAIRPDRVRREHVPAQAGRMRYTGSLHPGGAMIPSGVASGLVRAAGNGARMAYQTERVAARTTRTVGRMSGGRQGYAPRAPQAEALASRPMLPARREPGTVATRPRQHVPGDQLLNAVDRWLGKYARFPSASARRAVALWIAHAHCRDADGVLVFRATPRLYLMSSEPGSGKTLVLELLGMLCPATYGLDLEPTAPGLVFTIGREHATVLLDEGDILFGQGARKSSIRAIINGGYKRHGTVLNGRGAKASRVCVFGALAVAGLDVMEKGTGDTLSALMSRGIKIRMRKASGDDRPAKVTRSTEGEAAQLAMWLAAWAAQERDALADADPVAPEGIYGRAEEIWGPLLAIADAAGGDWPEWAREACTELALASEAPEEDVAAQIASFTASLGTGLEWKEQEQEDAPEWPWDGEPPADEEWTEEEPPAEEADEEPPQTIDQAPVPDEPYDAWIGVRGGKAEMLAAGEFEDVAKMVCQAKAGTFGMTLRWAVRDGGGWEAGTADIAFTVVPGRTQ